MIRNRFAILAFGATLALGSVAGFVGTAAAADGTPPETSTPVPSGPVSLTIPGVGLVSFNLDPLGAITDIVIAPEAGLTAGTPTLTTEGFSVDLTAADGTVRVFEVSVSNENGQLQIETGVEVGDNSGDNSGDNNGGQNTGDHGLHNGRTTDPQPDHGNDTGLGHQGGGNDNGGGDVGSTPPPPAPTTDNAPNNGGSGGHGGDHANNGLGNGDNQGGGGGNNGNNGGNNGGGD
jgi:hypothetical protein